MCLSELNIAASHFPRSSVISCSFWERNVLFGEMKMSQKNAHSSRVYLAHFWEALDILEIAYQSTHNLIGSGSSDDLILIFHLWLLAWQCCLQRTVLSDELVQDFNFIQSCQASPLFPSLVFNSWGKQRSVGFSGRLKILLPLRMVCQTWFKFLTPSW